MELASLFGGIVIELLLAIESAQKAREWMMVAALALIALKDAPLGSPMGLYAGFALQFATFMDIRLRFSVN